MPRGGPRPNSGPPKGNLNAYKSGRTSKQHQRLLHIISRDPEALQLLTSIARTQRRRRRHAEREAADLLQSIADRIRHRALDDASAAYENNQRIPPPTGSHHVT